MRGSMPPLTHVVSSRFVSSRKSLARTNRTSQTGVVATIFVVPQRKPLFDAAAKHFDFRFGTSRGIGGNKLVASIRNEILVVSEFQNGIENVLNLLHLFQLPTFNSICTGRDSGTADMADMFISRYGKQTGYRYLPTFVGYREQDPFAR